MARRCFSRCCWREPLSGEGERGRDGDRQRDRGTESAKTEKSPLRPPSLLSVSLSLHLPSLPGPSSGAIPPMNFTRPRWPLAAFPSTASCCCIPPSPDSQGKEMIWAATECLRCKGVGAVVASPGRLSRIEAPQASVGRRAGGGVGLLLRHTGRDSTHHAAASRWLVRPAPGARTLQRWTIELLHGHGGRIGHILCLELCRETNHLRTFDPVADRQAETITRAS